MDAVVDVSFAGAIFVENKITTQEGRANKREATIRLDWLFPLHARCLVVGGGIMYLGVMDNIT